MPGSMAISSPADYRDFPAVISLCKVREVRGNLVFFCTSRTIGFHEDICDWHKAMQAQHRRDGLGRWAGVEVVLQ